MSDLIIYKGRGITRLGVSGMFEIYSEKEKRFLKFDCLGDTKRAIRSGH